MGETSRVGRAVPTERRRYDAPVRRQRAADTRERIVRAGSELAHDAASWDWKALTFRAVAERAGVSERTVYRHFPNDRQLHDAVMQRLEHEAGITYEDVDLPSLTAVTAKVFATLQSFAAQESVHQPDDPTFVAVGERRRRALLRSVEAAAPHWPERDRRVAAALLDVLWNLPSYEQLVNGWHLSPDEATGGLTWLMEQVIASASGGGPSPMAPG
jgi:AcrR family transcriptional regulator